MSNKTKDGKKPATSTSKEVKKPVSPTTKKTQATTTNLPKPAVKKAPSTAKPPTKKTGKPANKPTKPKKAAENKTRSSRVANLRKAQEEVTSKPTEKKSRKTKKHYEPRHLSAEEKAALKAQAAEQKTKKKTAKQKSALEKEDAPLKAAVANKKKSKLPIIIGTVILAIGALWFGIEANTTRFKDVTIELGQKNIEIKDFLIKEKDFDKAVFLSDLATIDFSIVGETELQLKYNKKVETVKLIIEDTTAPVVVFQDLVKYIGYDFAPEDFIVTKSDLSPMSVRAEGSSSFDEFMTYVVKIIVTDSSGNETAADCKLTIIWLQPEVTVELGTKFGRSLICADVEKFGSYLTKSEMKKVNTDKVGEYRISATYQDKEYTSLVKVQDTTKPTLKLKSLTRLINKKVKAKDFVKKAYDASGKVEITFKKPIDYTIIGTQNVTILATDRYGNSTEATTTLTIKRSNKGPKFSGLKTLNVAKHSTIDYRKGVKAKDPVDGNCSFTVDSSKVNVDVAGTYYATYTAINSEGNKTTAKRKIVVKHDKEDTDRLFNAFYDKYLAGKSIAGMASTIKSKIKYNSSWGGKDPVWYAMNNHKGNCYVHAVLLKKALDKKGVTNQLIWTTGKWHYWNLVYSGGVWRHYDSTQSHIVGPATDAEKFASKGLKGHNWDRSKWPAAN